MDGHRNDNDDDDKRNNKQQTTNAIIPEQNVRNAFPGIAERVSRLWHTQQATAIPANIKIQLR